MDAEGEISAKKNTACVFRELQNSKQIRIKRERLYLSELHEVFAGVFIFCSASLTEVWQKKRNRVVTSVGVKLYLEDGSIFRISRVLLKRNHFVIFSNCQIVTCCSPVWRIKHGNPGESSANEKTSADSRCRKINWNLISFRFPNSFISCQSLKNSSKKARLGFWKSFLLPCCLSWLYPCFRFISPGP